MTDAEVGKRLRELGQRSYFDLPVAPHTVDGCDATMRRKSLSAEAAQ